MHKPKVIKVEQCYVPLDDIAKLEKLITSDGYDENNIYIDSEYGIVLRPKIKQRLN